MKTAGDLLTGSARGGVGKGENFFLVRVLVDF